MLGINARQAAWQWQAVGKHPAAADYIQLLEGTPLTKALGDWMRKGYDQWQAGRPGAHEPCSWRFWMRGGQTEHLVCGVVRDSSDRIGRPFPLMVVGQGIVKGWERQWPQLPLILDKTWSRLERLAVHGYEDLKALEEELRQLAAPSERDAGSDGGAQPPLPGEPLRACQADLQRTGRALIALGVQPGLDPQQNALHWHAGLQSCCPVIPRAVFMGGNPGRAYLSAILRPLTAADFVALWSVA